MLDRHDRIRQRIKLNKEERVQELAEDSLVRGLRMAIHILRRLKMNDADMETIISEKMVEFFVKEQVDTTSLTTKITKAEKDRKDKEDL